MKADISLFSRLFMACQTRVGDLDAFFAHENCPCPPSLSENQSSNQTNKADLVKCLEGVAQSSLGRPKTEATIIDGTHVVHKLDPKHSTMRVRTLQEFAQNVFGKIILGELEQTDRLQTGRHFWVLMRIKQVYMTYWRVVLNILLSQRAKFWWQLVENMSGHLHLWM